MGFFFFFKYIDVVFHLNNTKTDFSLFRYTILKQDWINIFDHLCISGIEPSSVQSCNRWCKKLKIKIFIKSKKRNI